MNSLQKKCIIATAGFHLLLVVILFVGPGFFRKEPPKTDALPVLPVVSLTAVEDALTRGTAASTPPPAPQPPTPPQPATPTPPTPEPPKPVVTPPVEPKPVAVKPVETHVEPTPVVTKPREPDVPQEKPSDEPDPIAPPKPQHKVEISLELVNTPTKPHPHRDNSKAKEAAEEARIEKEERAEAARKERAFRDAARSIEDNASSSTDVSIRGTSSAATVNYGQLVKSIYYNAWTLPASSDSAEASPKVRVVIGRDGTVLSAHIIEPSGDAAVDDSVQRALESVSTIQPFAESAKEQERTYIIKFDAKTKRML